MQQNNKGFLLVDSLISVFVTSLVCVACYSTYHLIVKYQDGYEDYQTLSDEHLLDIYNNLYECEPCEIIECESCDIDESD